MPLAVILEFNPGAIFFSRDFFFQAPALLREGAGVYTGILGYELGVRQYIHTYIHIIYIYIYIYIYI